MHHSPIQFRSGWANCCSIGIAMGPETHYNHHPAGPEGVSGEVGQLLADVEVIHALGRVGDDRVQAARLHQAVQSGDGGHMESGG